MSFHLGKSSFFGNSSSGISFEASNDFEASTSQNPFQEEESSETFTFQNSFKEEVEKNTESEKEEVKDDLRKVTGDSKFKFDCDWADISDDEEEINLTDLEISEKDLNLSFKQKCCSVPTTDFTKENANDFYGKLMTFLQHEIEDINVDCHLNQLDCVLKGLLFCKNEEDYKMANILHFYLKFRHDLLSFWFSKTLNLEVSKTDVSFKEIFGIESVRTPDFIINKGKTYHIIEVTAVSDYERGQRDKGSIEKGYTSKYKEELEILSQKGFDVCYHVMTFVISKEEEKDHLKDLEKISDKMGLEVDNPSLMCLEMLRRIFCDHFIEVNRVYGKYYGVLFNLPYSLKNDYSHAFKKTHGESSNPFTGFYERINISADDYYKILKNLDYISDMFYKNYLPNKKYFIILNPNTGKFRIEENYKGLDSEEMFEALEKKDMKFLTKYFRIKVGDTIQKSTKSELEFFNYQQIGLNSEKNEINWKTKHKNSEEITILNFSEIKVSESNKEFVSYSTQYEDNEYEEKILKMIMDFDLNSIKKINFKNTPLSNKILNEKMISDAVNGFKKSYFEHNDFSKNPNIIVYNKFPFLYPIYKPEPNCQCSIHEKPYYMNEIRSFDFGPYTNRLIKIISEDSFLFGTQKKFLKENPFSKERSDLQTLAFNLQKEKFKSSENKRNFPKLKEVDPDFEISNKLREINKKIRDWESKQPKNEISIIKLPTKNNESLKSDFKKEMSHFKVKKSHSCYKGVGRSINFNFIETCFVKLKKIFMSPSGVSLNEKLYDDWVSEDVKLFEDLKKAHIKDNSELKGKLEGTFLFCVCSFISRLCHTLLYYSQTSSNSDFVYVDNLGFNNVLIFVKGGKKIFPTKKSRLFRLLYPTYSPITDIMNTMPGSSYTSYYIGGQEYIMTPWQSLHETLLTDGLTMVQRCMGFLMLNMMNSKDLDFNENMDKYMLNVTLALHGRRQTEVFMHNMRYLTMNCLSHFTALDEILPELSGFNYDAFQFYLRECIMLNFKKFALEINKIYNMGTGEQFKTNLKNFKVKHFINGHLIENLEDLATSVYSTYLMSKSPTTQSLEQVKNLKKMMETHEYYYKNKKENFENKSVIVENCKDLADYYEKLNENDFNFDPKYCSLLGKFMSDYLSNLTTSSEISQKWETLLSKNWDDFANTKGLRGGEDSGFFSGKGYHVVYAKIIENNSEFNTKVVDLIKKTTMSLKEIQKELNDLNFTYRDELKVSNFKSVIFHVVDKIQRGGEREIMVMDLNTKIHQQLIEGLSSFLCKLIPNEMISIPSNKRLSNIHHKVFEGGKMSKKRFYFVLDCRKWAPRSVIEKFPIFISSMRGILPESFIRHCLSFFQLMVEDKRIYTKNHIYEICKNNVSFDSKISYFIKDESRGGYYFRMNYSWMMGIFNYLSSFFHVANQLHISHISKIAFQLKKSEDVNLHMIAHSDDSAGKLDCESVETASEVLFIYETLMKSSNHMISKKKSNIGETYYEMISILYIAKTLMSLLAKFTGMFNFHPSDEGYCSDINESYSKCTELLLNGSTFEQSYIGFKIQSNLIERFYFQNKRPKIYYNLPPSLLGIPDSHPLMILLCGSDSDMIRIMETKEEKFIENIFYLSDKMSDKNVPSETILKPLICHPIIRANKKTKSLMKHLTDEIKCLKEDNWSLTNVNFKNSTFNAVQFLFKLSDPKFRSSLQDEMLSRRISRSFYFRTNKCISTSYGNLSYGKLMEIIDNVLFSENEEIFSSLEESVVKDVYKNVKIEVLNNKGRFDIFMKLYKSMYSEPIRLCDYLNTVIFNPANVEVQNKTTKPLHIFLKHSHETISDKINISNLCSWIKEPEFRNFLPDTRNFHHYSKVIEMTLEREDLKIDDITIEQLYTFCLKLKGRSSSEYFCYSNVPHNLREIGTYQDILNFLSHNSFKNKYVKGITAPLGKTITSENLEVFKSYGEPIHWTVCLLKILNLFSESEKNDLMNLVVKVPYFLLKKTKNEEKEEEEKEKEEKNLFEIFDLIKKYWEKSKEDFSILGLEIEKTNYLIKKRVLNPGILAETFYHTFLKRQFLVDNVWLGQGEIFISLGKLKIVFVLINQRIGEIFSNVENYILNETQANYLNYIFKQINMDNIKNYLREVTVDMKNQSLFGIDENGNYVLGDSNIIVRGLKMSVSLFMRTKLMSPELGVLKLNNSQNLIWQESPDSKVKYQIKVLPLDPADCLSMLEENFLKNEKNFRIIEEFETSNSKSIAEFLCENLNVELFLKRDDLLEEFSSSEIYKILKFCSNKNLCKVVNVNLNYDNFQGFLPAPDGGLLNALIKYAEKNDKFRFNWEQEITPAFMAIKNAQPEAFVIDLLGNIKEKFMALYDKDERDYLISKLTKLIKENKNDDFFNTLCTWGYVGVAGALENLEENQSIENFKTIRVYNANFPFLKNFSKTFEILIDSIFLTMQEELDSKQNIYSYLGINKNNFKFIFSSLIHIFNLQKYRNRKCFTCIGDKMEDSIFQSWIELVLSDDKSLKIFKSKIKDSFTLSNLPMGKKHINDWIIAYNSLKQNYLNFKIIGKNLNFTVVREILDNCQSPFDLTKNYLSKFEINLPPSKYYHHGVFSKKFTDFFKTPYVGKYKNQYAKVDFEFKNLKDFNLPSYNILYWPKHVLSQEFLESDEFGDYEMELASEEPDLDYLKSIVEDFEGEIYDSKYKAKLKKTNVIIEGKRFFGDVLCFPVTILIEFCLPESKKRLDGIRNTGENIVIYSHIKFLELSGLEKEGVVLFLQPVNNIRFEKSIILPEMITITVISSYNDLNFWCKMLNAKPIDQRKPLNIVKTSSGKNVDYNFTMSLEEKVNLFDEEDKIEEEEKKFSEEIKESNVDILIKKSEEKGYSKKNLLKIKRYMKKLEEKNDNDNLFEMKKMINAYFSGEIEIDQIIKKGESMIKSSLLNRGMTTEEHESIFIIPEIHRGYKSKKSDIKNTALKDQKLIAEINSIIPNLSQKIISGTLVMTERLRKRILKRLKMYRNHVKTTKFNVENKKSYMNLLSLIIKDSKPTKDMNQIEKDHWDELLDWLDDKMEDPDSDDEDDEIESFSKESGVSKLIYKTHQRSVFK